MKKAKLKKLMLQAKEAHSKKGATLKKLNENLTTAKEDFVRSKENLKAARKQHKDARRHFRKLQKALKACQTDRREALDSFARIEKKWRKLNKREKQTSPGARSKLARSGKANKTSIKVVPPQEVLVQ